MISNKCFQPEIFFWYHSRNQPCDKNSIKKTPQAMHLQPLVNGWPGLYSFIIGFLDGLYQAGQGMIYGSRDSQCNSFPNDSAVDEVHLGDSLL
jgi:hypothetical protein